MSGLEISGLRLELGGRAILDGVDVAVPAGQVTGLAGESGSGKTMTGLAVIGLAPAGAEVTGTVRYDDGEVRIDDLLALRPGAMNRLPDASSGQILVEGSDILALRGSAQRQWQSDCAMIFQQFNLVPRMDVASNVLHGILNRRSVEIYEDKKRALRQGDEAVMKQIGEGKDIMSILSTSICASTIIMFDNPSCPQCGPTC